MKMCIRDSYYTMVTMGMGAYHMNVPEELAEYKLERAELAIALPADRKLDQESMKDERWYWPIRLLKGLARFPIECETWLGCGHTMDNEEPFAGNTKLCASILIEPQNAEDGSEVCVLPGGEEVNFYQVIPLYEDELNYKLEDDADALLDKMAGISFVVNPTRQDAIIRGTLSDDDFDGEMDDASYHIESIEQSLVSENPLVRIFSLLDRRLGKRRLLALEESMEQELDWVRAFYVTRMQAEGLMEKE